MSTLLQRAFPLPLQKRLHRKSALNTKCVCRASPMASWRVLCPLPAGAKFVASLFLLTTHHTRIYTTQKYFRSLRRMASCGSKSFHGQSAHYAMCNNRGSRKVWRGSCVMSCAEEEDFLSRLSQGKYLRTPAFVHELSTEII